jgi:hypothetical protein
MIAACRAIVPPAVSRMAPGSEIRDLSSRLEPTEKKKTPSSSDLIG